MTPAWFSRLSVTRPGVPNNYLIEDGRTEFLEGPSCGPRHAGWRWCRV